jgi:hypothetical protein
MVIMEKNNERLLYRISTRPMEEFIGYTENPFYDLVKNRLQYGSVDVKTGTFHYSF